MSRARTTRKRGARAEVPITRDAIVDAAFRMIDERGNEGFSMRSLATELGVFPATVYWHVGDRAELLGLVQQRWMSAIETPDHIDDWRAWLLELARRYRANALRHPRIARLVSVERARNTDTLVVPDAVLGKLAEVGFGDEIVHVYNALLGAVQGFVVMELSPIAEAGEGAPDAARRDLTTLDPERFPNIARHWDQLGNRALSLRWTDAVDAPMDESFDYLLGLLIDGMAARLDRLDH